jgi:hypothetical protein
MNETGGKAGRFLVNFTLAAIGSAVLFLSVNYFTDRYYVFHPRDDVFEEILEPNTRVLKARYLERHCADFNAIIMGSSRDVAYNTEDVNRVFGVNAYNFAVASGHLRGILARLEWLGRMDCLPERVFLPFSIDRLRLPQNANDLLRKEYPGIIGTKAYAREFLLSYIGADAFVSNLRRLLRRLRKDDSPKFRYDMGSGDVHYLWDREVSIQACAGKALQANEDTIRLFAEFLLAIQSLVARHGSELTLIWNPLPLPDQLSRLEDARALFAQLGDAFDAIYRLPLSHPGLLSSDHYHDPGHFKRELGAAVIESGAHRISPGALLLEMESARANLRTSCSSPGGSHPVSSR